MALTILNEQYPPRKPKLTLTADSLDELPTDGVAEGSTATVGGTEYSYDSNAGWIVPGEGGGGSGDGTVVLNVVNNMDDNTFEADFTFQTVSEYLANAVKMVLVETTIYNGEKESVSSVITPMYYDGNVGDSESALLLATGVGYSYAMVKETPDAQEKFMFCLDFNAIAITEDNKFYRMESQSYEIGEAKNNTFDPLN